MHVYVYTMYCFTLAAKCRTIRLELNSKIPPSWLAFTGPQKGTMHASWGEKASTQQSYPVVTPKKNDPTCQAKCILLCNSGTTVLGTTKCSLISFEACTTERKILAGCCKPGQNYTFGDGICLSSELTSFSFLTKLIQHHIASHVCAHRQMLFRVFIR